MRGRNGGRLVARDGGASRELDDAYVMLLRRDDQDAWRIAGLAWHPASSGKTAEREALLAADRAFATAAAAGEMDRVFEFWTADAEIFAPGRPAVRGKQAIRAFVTESRARPGFSIRWEPEDATVSNDATLGTSRGSYRVAFSGPDGVPVVRTGIYVESWRKDDGSWKCTVEIQAPFSEKTRAGGSILGDKERIMARRASGAVALVAGAAVGALILGLAGRGVTAAIALVMGRPTNLSASGLMEAVLVGTLFGAAGGVLLLLIGTFRGLAFPSRGFAVGAVLFLTSLLLAWFTHGIENGAQPGTLIAVAVVFMLYGLLLDAIVRRVETSA